MTEEEKAALVVEALATETTTEWCMRCQERTVFRSESSVFEMLTVFRCTTMYGAVLRCGYAFERFNGQRL